MKLTNIVIGTTLIILSIWFYLSLSTFPVEKGDEIKRIVIKEGIARTIDEVAMVLSEENGFDLEGAYKSGYKPVDVVEYLIKAPHDYSVTFYEGEYYEGRQTVLHIIPFLVCVFLAILGVGIILPKRKFKKS